MKNPFGKEVSIVLFYAVYIGISSIINRFYLGGPCTPGLGFLLFLLLVPVSLAWVLIDFYHYLKTKRPFFRGFAVHLIFWFVFLIVLKTVRF